MEETAEKKVSQKDIMLTGTSWRVAGDFLSKVLGVIYIIPWYAWMGQYGNQANALYSMGYNVYALFLLISTVGIPVAVSREVAKYNAMGDENMSFRLVRQMFLVMILLGGLAAAAMWALAPAFAAASGNPKTLVPVMQSLAWPILIFPSMSIIRGYFQGTNNFKPFAVSQFIEQLARVIWMLSTTFAIMKMGDKNWANAVTQSTFAAFIGMLASWVVLIFYLARTHELRKIAIPGPARQRFRAGKMLVQTMIQAVPFIVIGSAIQIFKLIDQTTFPHVMGWVSNFNEVQLNVFFSYFSANTDKLTMVLIGAAMTMGTVALPLITKNFVDGNRRESAKLISYNFQLYMVFMLPAIVAMSLLAEPLYVVFYQVPDGLQTGLFIFAVVQSLLLGLYTMAVPMLQGLHYSRVAMRYFFMTLVLKLLLQVPFIMLFQSYGALLATTFSFSMGCVLFIRKLKKVTGFRWQWMRRSLLTALFMTMIMTIVMAVAVAVLRVLFKDASRLQGLAFLLVAGGLGAIVYLVLMAKFGLLEKLMGSRGEALRRKLHL